MSADEAAEARRAWLREAMVLAGFIALIGIAAWTVAVPELSEAPPSEARSTAGRSADAGI